MTAPIDPGVAVKIVWQDDDMFGFTGITVDADHIGLTLVGRFIPDNGDRKILAPWSAIAYVELVDERPSRRAV